MLVVLIIIGFIIAIILGCQLGYNCGYNRSIIDLVMMSDEKLQGILIKLKKARDKFKQINGESENESNTEA